MTAPFRLSFEFFPPKNEEGRAKLAQVHTTLRAFEPEYFSVTYGAGGSTRDNTRHTVAMLAEAGSAVAPHLSFGGDDEATIIDLLKHYRALGISHLVALRGDRPSGLGGARMVYAAELVALVRAHFGDSFHIEVAAYPEIHPEAKSYIDDVRYLKQKFERGADSALTQYFYNADAYFYFMEACRREGIDGPVVPGIMPITNFKNLCRFSDSCGADIPRWVRKKLDGFGDNQASVTAFGRDYVGALCQRLLDGGAPGLHFYTMNQAKPTGDLVRGLLG